MSNFRTLKYPVSVFWETTPLCNHDCIHCFNYWRSDREKAADLRASSSEVSLKKMRKKIEELHPVTVIITGGEPLMVWDKLRPEIEHLVNAGIRVTMNTNAAMMTEEIADFLAQNKISLLVSFPCADEAVNDLITNIPGSYKRIRNGLSILCSAKVSFSANMVVSKKNLPYIAETAKLLVTEYGVKRLSLSRVGKPVNAGISFEDLRLNAAEVRQLIRQTVEIHEQYGIDVDASSPYPVCALESDEEYELLGGKRLCSAGKTSLVIGSDGGVKACPRDSHVYGNFLSEPFNIIWDRMNEWRTDELYPDKCRDCNVFSSCRGACRADSLADAGNCRAMDSAARPERLPLSFQKKKNNLPHYEEQELFYFLTQTDILKEQEGYRISHWGRHVFVSEKAMRFLQDHPVFCKQDLSDVVEEKETDAVIWKLISNGIISTSKTE